jgi:hypothetical protein
MGFIAAMVFSPFSVADRFFNGIRENPLHPCHLCPVFQKMDRQQAAIMTPSKSKYRLG